jgi:uncharacterized protein (TIGR03083 family)
MDELEIRRIVEAERLSLCDALDGLDAPQWSTPSLCTGWTVREVVAHLTLPTRTSLPAMVLQMARARGDFDRMADRAARRRAARSEPKALVARLRGTAGSPRRMPGSSAMDPLVDVLVHAQDVCLPLGIQRRMPVPAAVAALDHVTASTFFGAPARLEGLRPVATDSAWTHGPADGPVVRGATQDLLLAATGRAAGLAGLQGAGAGLLRSRLGTTTAPAGEGDGRR